MKKTLFAAVLVLGFLFVGCFDNQFGNSPKGSWTHIGNVETYCNGDTSITEEYFYKPEIDQYYIAAILKITDNEMIGYYNDDGEEFNIDTMYTVSYSDDSLYLSAHGYSDNGTIAYYFNENNNMVWIIEDYGDYKNEWHFEKFNGIIPPDSWLGYIEADEYETDGDIDHATDIELNYAQSHTLSSNDSDYYCLQANEGNSYLIQGMGYFQFELYLYDQNGDSIAHDSNNDLRIDGLGDETETVLLWTCEADGDYYPMVMPTNRYTLSDHEGYYQIQVTEVDTNDIEYCEPEGCYTTIYGSKKVLNLFDNIMNK